MWLNMRCDHEIPEDRQKDHLQVQQQTPVLDIAQVIGNASLHFLYRIGFAPATADLRQACNAGLDLVSEQVLRYFLTGTVHYAHRMRLGAEPISFP